MSLKSTLEFDYTKDVYSQSPHLFYRISRLNELIVVVVNQALHTLVERAYFSSYFPLFLQ